MAQPQVTLNDLAAKITDLTQQFSKVLADDGVQQPTFAPDSPVSYDGLTAESFTLRQKLTDAINDLWFLTQGPSESIFNYCHNVMPDQAALSILNSFNFWAAVPLDGTATYDEIADKVRLPLDIVRRVLEHGTTLHLFAKAGSPSTVRHTSRSAALAKNPGLQALVTTILDDAGPPMTVIPEALRRHVVGKKEVPRDMDKTAFTLFHSGAPFGKPFTNSWDFIENDGEGQRKGWRQRNFVEFMKYLRDIFHLESVIVDSYDWKSAGKAKVVDLGGSGGHDAVVLAKKFPELEIIVQDLPEAGPAFEADTPAELKSRVSFMAHDFFNPQTVQPDIFLIKLILHDWPDEESIKILRGLVPAMRPGTKVVFIEYVGKQSNADDLPRSIQQMGTATDLRMLALFNAEERPVEAWKRIFKAADERFVITRVDANPLTFYMVIEAVWQE